MLKCSKCGVEKPLSDFYVNRKTGKPKGQRCKKCISDSNGEYQRKNRERSTEMQRAWRFKKKYGVTLDDYDRLLQAQGGRCAICGGVSRGRSERFHVDHCHKTGRVRGLLCNPCNRGLGLLADNPELIDKAAAYIEASREVPAS